MEHALMMRLLMLLLMGVIGMVVWLVGRTPSARSEQSEEIRIPENANAKEYVLWLARQQGYDLSHRVGGGVARYLVLKPAPQYWPPKLGGPVGAAPLPAGFPPPTPEQLQTIRREIRKTGNTTSSTFVAIAGACCGTVLGWEAVRRMNDHSGFSLPVGVLAAVLFLFAAAALLKSRIDRRRRRTRFSAPAPESLPLGVQQPGPTGPHREGRWPGGIQ